MSIDAHDIAKHEQNRGLPDVCRKIKKANEVFPLRRHPDHGEHHGEPVD